MQHKCVYAERLSPYMLALSCFAIFQYDKSPWPWGHRVQAADRRTSKLAPAMSPGRIVGETPRSTANITAYTLLQKCVVNDEVFIKFKWNGGTSGHYVL